MNDEIYRTKGMISRTPPSTSDIAVRKLTTACAMEGTFYEDTSQIYYSDNQPEHDMTYVKVLQRRLRKHDLKTPPICGDESDIMDPKIDRRTHML